MKTALGSIFGIIFLLFAGIGMGLGIAWGVMPIKIIDTAPGTLNQKDKDRYRILIAEDFIINTDMTQALRRLEYLDGQGYFQAITDQIKRRAWISAKEETSLAALQSAVLNSQNIDGQTRIPLEMIQQNISTDTPENPNRNSTPAITGLTIVSTTPVITSSQSVFKIISRTPTCGTRSGYPLLQVIVVDNYGNPRNGVVILISSVEGSERIITGLKPNAGAGMADFILSEGINYTVTLENAVGVPEILKSTQCNILEGGSALSGWMMKIQY